ncbi:cytochrome P450 monooxygenase [Fusarium acutatum]|uniref:Cytochrome P450 monooxygenase n=1 Tax=Fusarium acutatum TaxID=78861 RepID=A0A8H4NHD7_9HYPO|nr:cytochrome P450 monooxygenase [Fusarium acutatum]
MKHVRNSGIGATNIFSKLVAENEKDSEALTDYQVAFEAGGFIVAGSRTTAVTLTYLVWAVLSNPDIQARIEAEVAALQPNYTGADLEPLPYPSALIEETLRLYSAAPGAIPVARRRICSIWCRLSYLLGGSSRAYRAST